MIFSWGKIVNFWGHFINFWGRDYYLYVSEEGLRNSQRSTGHDLLKVET